MPDTPKAPLAEKRTSAEMKWSATNNEARTILERETRERERKTERLRRARLAQEAAAEDSSTDAPEAPSRARRKRPAKR